MTCFFFKSKREAKQSLFFKLCSSGVRIQHYVNCVQFLSLFKESSPITPIFSCPKEIEIEVETSINSAKVQGKHSIRQRPPKMFLQRGRWLGKCPYSGVNLSLGQGRIFHKGEAKRAYTRKVEGLMLRCALQQALYTFKGDVKNSQKILLSSGQQEKGSAQFTTAKRTDADPPWMSIRHNLPQNAWVQIGKLTCQARSQQRTRFDSLKESAGWPYLIVCEEKGIIRP
eukprot:TRINITY_DN9999_c0_g2_i1.p1 TRINITY_DN9999_c0_g2~~TRINITY_DN9999_c0_g2_i1.p1  ORF type:complete len:227 (-),score=-6.82 TRINITY_DN9999_c0_g2_i1:263-943(-)